MFGIIIALLVGAFVGWGSSLYLKVETDEDAFTNIGIGALGAIIAALCLRVRGISGADLEEALSIPVVLVAMSGAAFLIAFVTLIRGSSPVSHSH